MSLTVVIRSVSSLVSLPGLGMIAMGLGVVDVDPEMWAVATAVLGPALVPAKPFLLVLGSSKVMGVLGLWGLGFFSKMLSYAACAIPALCAVYGHAQLGEMDKAGAAGFYIAILSTLYYLESAATTKSSKKE
jgi:hypothetical protein